MESLLVIGPVPQFDVLFPSRSAHIDVVDGPSRSRNARFSFAEEAKETAGSEQRASLSAAAFFFPFRSPSSSHLLPTLLSNQLPISNNNSSWTNKLITAKDHAAVQINVGHLNAEGIFTGATTTLALAGNVRAWGAADTAVDLLWKVRR